MLKTFLWSFFFLFRHCWIRNCGSNSKFHNIFWKIIFLPPPKKWRKLIDCIASEYKNLQMSYIWKKKWFKKCVKAKVGFDFALKNIISLSIYSFMKSKIRSISYIEILFWFIYLKCGQLILYYIHNTFNSIFIISEEII